MNPSHSFMSGIETLDLENVTLKLMAHSISGETFYVDPLEVHGENWPKEHCARVCEEYRKFLALKRAYPEFADVVPSCPIDVFWHYHILDTRKYAADCEAIVGYFLHHFPYYGMRGADDARNLELSWYKTQAAYRRHFGGNDADQFDPFREYWLLPAACG